MDFDRDNNGRIINKTEDYNGVASDYVYTYDPMGRLLTVTKDSILVEEYVYSQNGTRTYEMNSLRGIAGRSLTYSDEDHLLTAGGTTYQYNLDGYLTSKTNGDNTTTYDYSSRGELLSVSLPDGNVISYVHDPLGRRIARKVNGAITEKYLWQGMTQLLAVYNGSNSLIMRFEYADDRMPVAMIHGGATYYLAYDQVGSLKAVSDASGSVVKSIDYDSFGNIITDTNPSFTMPLGFAGGLYDLDTGLVRFGYRDYDPDTGRWTAKDPILFAGCDMDLYGYCLNDPVNFVDPFGLASLKFDPDTNTMWFSNDEVTYTYEARNDVVGAHTPMEPGVFHADDVFPYSIGANPRYGSGYTYIDTKDPSKKDIHGGGNCSEVSNSYEDYQGWCPTWGCIRMQNDDIKDLSRRILEYKKKNPGKTVPFDVVEHGYKWQIYY